MVLMSQSFKNENFIYVSMVSATNMHDMSGEYEYISCTVKARLPHFNTVQVGIPTSLCVHVFMLINPQGTYAHVSTFFFVGMRLTL